MLVFFENAIDNRSYLVAKRYFSHFVFLWSVNRNAPSDKLTIFLVVVLYFCPCDDDLALIKEKIFRL